MAEAKERLLTSYRIWASEDGGETATLLGEVLAGSSDEALKKWFADPPRDEDTGAWYAAVSVNAQRWRQVAAKVTTRFSEPSNDPAEPEPVQEPLA